MFIGKKDKEGNIYYTFSDLPKIHILTEFFKYGFYVRVGMKVKYDEPVPVLCREEPDIEKNQGILFQFGDNAFMSDESEKYEFYILDNSWCDCNTWIIQDMDGNIRVWDRTMMDELFFFGKEAECVYEKTDRGEYLQVAV